MSRIALKMLFGDLPKYLGLVLGVAFSTLLINQQMGIFFGLLERAASVITDTPEAHVWVMDPGVDTFDTVFPMRDTELPRVRGISGVKWAVPMFRTGVALRTGSGRLVNGLLLGVDNNSLIGVPQKVVLGSLENLKNPDAIAVSTEGYSKLWPKEPLQLGKTLELNDRRAVIEAIVEASPSFGASTILFARYSQALLYTNTGRNQLSLILVHCDQPTESAEVAARIAHQTGLRALTSAEFKQKSINYIWENTGIPVSVGMVVALGALVGVSVVGLLFNLFVLENLRQFAVLKAIGVRNSRVLQMVVLQSLVVGFVGYAFGITAAASFFEFVPKATPNFRGFYLPWQVAIATGGFAAAVMLLASLVGLRRVLFVDPAIVFRG